MLKDLIKANRSCRGYDRSRRVTKREMEEMVDCARLSAAGVNLQVLKYYVTNDKQEVAKLNELTKLGAMLPDLHLPFKGTEPPAYILICQDLDISDKEDTFTMDVGIAAQSITLAATEMGLAACMIGNYSQVKVHDAMGLAPNLKVRLIIAVGKSAEEIKIVRVPQSGVTAYYRDANGVHCVPKRSLKEVLIKK